MIKFTGSNKVITKYFLGFWAFLLSHIPAYADTSLEGIRVGLGLGAGIIDSTVQFTRSNQLHIKDTSDVSGRGVIGAILLDWGSVIGNSCTYMGLEGSFKLTTIKGKKSTNGTFVNAPATSNLSTTVQFTRAFELAAKIGYMMNDVAVPYIKAGPSLGRWRSNSASNEVIASGGTAQAPLGMLIGVGGDFVLTDRVSFGASYDYRRYSSLSYTLNTSDNTALRDVSVTPSSHAIMFNIKYKLSAIDYGDTPRKQKIRKRKRSRRAN